VEPRPVVTVNVPLRWPQTARSCFRTRTQWSSASAPTVRSAGLSPRGAATRRRRSARTARSTCDGRRRDLCPGWLGRHDKWQSPYRLSSNSINASLALDPGRSVLYAADEVGLFTAVNLDGTFGWQLSIGDDPSTPVIGATAQCISAAAASSGAGPERPGCEVEHHPVDRRAGLDAGGIRRRLYLLMVTAGKRTGGCRMSTALRGQPGRLAALVLRPGEGSSDPDYRSRRPRSTTTDSSTSATALAPGAWSGSPAAPSRSGRCSSATPRTRAVRAQVEADPEAAGQHV